MAAPERHIPGGAALEARPLLHLDRADLHRFELALSREWLEPDGLAGYASSTVLGCPTRRYHGLLVAVPDGASERHVFLSRFLETIAGPDRSYDLSLSRYPGTWVPSKDLALESFELVPWPRWTFRLGLGQFTREVMVPRGSRTVVTRWTHLGERSGLKLQVRPLLAFREARALTVENMALDGRVQRGANSRGEHEHVIRPYAALPSLRMRFSSGPDFEADPLWYRRLEYLADIARGYDGHEDQFCPGLYQFEFAPGAQITIAASIEQDLGDPNELFDREVERRERLAAGVAPLEGGMTPATVAGESTAERLQRVSEQLELAAADFLYRDTHGRPGVIAGYPWFGEWGRDTFLSLPGLTLSRGDSEGALDILRGALPYLRDGLLPNIYGASIESSHYGSADAALWFALAVWRADQALPDQNIFSEFLPALRSIVDAYRAGTELGLRVDESGLLHAGSSELNATWMDAQTSTGPVTPRPGFAVELCALWCFLLERLGETKEHSDLAPLAEQAGKSFRERFWLEDERYLADAWNEGRADRAVRPNQVMAAALPFRGLGASERRDVVRRVELELLTPRGLRTLSPKNPDYIGRYGGGSDERDGAYHQGTVWPWLLGFHAEATLLAFPDDEPRRDSLIKLITGFEEHLRGQGLLSVSEVFDGDPPHRPGGTIAQAWSVAELLRAAELIEDASR